jgi:hypothetical protein
MTMLTADSQEKGPPEFKLVGNGEITPTAPPHVKNPRRIAAGRLNQKKRRGLTDEGRARVRQAAYRVRPWEHSTGPKSPEGKARSAKNRQSRKRAINAYNELRAAVRSLIAPSMEMRHSIQRFLAESGHE